MRLSFLFKYCLHIEIIPAKIVARQLQYYYNISFFMYEGTMAFGHNRKCRILSFLKSASAIFDVIKIINIAW